MRATSVYYTRTRAALILCEACCEPYPIGQPHANKPIRAARRFQNAICNDCCIGRRFGRFADYRCHDEPRVQRQSGPVVVRSRAHARLRPPIGDGFSETTRRRDLIAGLARPPARHGAVGPFIGPSGVIVGRESLLRSSNAPRAPSRPADDARQHASWS